MDDFAVDVGEAHVAGGEAEGEFLVVRAEQVEHGGVQVVDLDLVLDGEVAVFVGGAVDGRRRGALGACPRIRVNHNP